MTTTGASANPNIAFNGERIARGVDRRWVRELYSFAVRPDLAVYFRVPIDVSLDRLMARRVKLKFYEAGMDMGWSTNAVESCRLFQGKVLDEYDRIVDGDYLRRGQEPPLRDEADAAQEHYAKRVSDAFQQAGSSINEVGQQLGDWLSRHRGAND